MTSPLRRRDPHLVLLEQLAVDADSGGIVPQLVVQLGLQLQPRLPPRPIHPLHRLQRLPPPASNPLSGAPSPFLLAGVMDSIRRLAASSYLGTSHQIPSDHESGDLSALPRQLQHK